MDVYRYLGAGPVAFLYGEVANEQEATLEERARHRLLQIAAQSSPCCARGGDLDPARPRVNPAHLLGVSVNASADEVRLPAGALTAFIPGVPITRSLTPNVCYRPCCTPQNMCGSFDAVQQLACWKWPVHSMQSCGRFVDSVLSVPASWWTPRSRLCALPITT